MIRNYFLITLRNMMNNKVFILINVFGMGIAIAYSIVAYLAYDYDASFDTVHANRQRIYRVGVVREFESSLTRYGFSPLPVREIIDRTFQEVDFSTRYFQSNSNFRRDNDLFPSRLSYVDPAFFQMFSFDFISGNPGALKDNTSVFVSEELANRLFSSPSEAIGKTITQVFGKVVKEVKIGGVFRDQPMNSSFYRKDGSAYMNFENLYDEYKDVREGDWKILCSTFVQINDASRVKSVCQQLQQYSENNNKIRDDFHVKEFVLDQFSGMAHFDRDEKTQSFGTWPVTPLSAIVGAIVMSIFILLIACFNMTNTSIAISARRLKEIGIRKVMGGMRSQLIFQFISETTFVCLLALIVGVGLADFLISGWNSLWEYMRLPHHFMDKISFLLFLIGVLLFTGIIAGSYPAFYVSKFEPVSILKGKLKFGGTNYFTRTLLGLQLAISMIAVVSAIGFLQNARYQREYDLGFDVNGTVIAGLHDQSEFDTYRNSLQSNPKIISIAGASSGIFSNSSHAPVKFESQQAEVDIIGVGDNYLKTMDLKLLQGRDFIRNSETDQRESVLVTERMVELFGWDKPLGKEIIWRDSVKLFVVGVVKDVYTKGLWFELEPMMIRYVLPDKYTQIVVSTKAGNVPAVNAFMNGEWNKLFPTRLYDGRMLLSDMDRVNDVNISIVYMYTFLGSVALLLSATGLFTMVSLNIIRRMKEIGVRKVLGASLLNITRIVNAEFVVILMAASLLGSWAGFAMSDMLMQSIWKYYQGVNASTFIMSVVLLFVIAFFTIGYKVYSIVIMNPVNSLRDE